MQETDDRDTVDLGREIDELTEMRTMMNRFKRLPDDASVYRVLMYVASRLGYTVSRMEP